MKHGAEIERAVSAFARTPNDGLIVIGSALAASHRDLLVRLTAEHKLTAVYYDNLIAYCLNNSCRDVSSYPGETPVPGSRPRRNAPNAARVATRSTCGPMERSGFSHRLAWATDLAQH